MDDKKYVTVIRRDQRGDETKRCEFHITKKWIVTHWTERRRVAFRLKDGCEVGRSTSYMTDPYYELGPNWRQEIGHE